MQMRAKVTASRPDRRAAVLALAFLLLAAGIGIALPALAADEDTQASVYLVFDPETGEFVTVHEGAGDSQAAGDAGGGTGAAAAARPDPGAAGAPAVATNPTFIAGLVVAAVLVLGGAAWYRKSRA
ncbi:MAG: hypothetical protein R3176_03875 [Woeseiaceae bacterium]|nr:hypothetical protein [Woeseiaceae bacterium]